METGLSPIKGPSGASVPVALRARGIVYSFLLRLCVGPKQNFNIKECQYNNTIPCSYTKITMQTRDKTTSV